MHHNCYCFYSRYLYHFCFRYCVRFSFQFHLLLILYLLPFLVSLQLPLSFQYIIPLLHYYCELYLSYTVSTLSLHLCYYPSALYFSCTTTVHCISPTLIQHCYFISPVLLLHRSPTAPQVHCNNCISSTRNRTDYVLIYTAFEWHFNTFVWKTITDVRDN